MAEKSMKTIFADHGVNKKVVVARPPKFCFFQLSANF